MISDIDKYVDFLVDNDLNEHSFLILWLVHTKDVENIKKYKLKFGNFSSDAIEYLIDRGWLIDLHYSANGLREYNINELLVSDKFVNRVVIDEEDAYEELVRAYPKWIKINGVNRPTTNGNPRELAKEYLKYHRKNKLAHERVLNITTRYFQSNPVFEGIEKYILHRHWNLLEEKLTFKPVFQQL